jgi:hypothetical protein
MVRRAASVSRGSVLLVRGACGEGIVGHSAVSASCVWRGNCGTAVSAVGRFEAPALSSFDGQKFENESAGTCC